MPTAIQPNPNAPGQRGQGEDVQATLTSPADDARTVLINRITWGAVFAGVALMLVTQLLLNMIGVGIGAASVDPGAANNPTASSFGTGAGIWWGLSGIIAAFLGGLVAGRLSGSPRTSTSAMHGLTAWAITTLVIIYLFSSAAAALIGGTLNTVASATRGAGNIAQTAVQSAAPAVADPFSSIEQAIRGGGNDPASARDAAISAVRALLTGDQAQAQAARDRAAEAIARAQGIPVEDARARVGEYEQQYRQQVEQARATATRAADTAATAVSTASLLAALALALGALAAWFGGRLGTVDTTVMSGYGRTLTGRGERS